MKFSSLDELLKKDVVFVKEDNANYYVRLKPETEFDNRMYQVDKGSGKVTTILMTVYLSIDDKTRPVDITTLKKKTLVHSSLYHHGITGQRWGVRNGPPYPLKPGAHSSAEKKDKSTTSRKTAAKDDKTGGVVSEALVAIARKAIPVAVYAAIYASARVKMNKADKAQMKKGEEIAKQIIAEKTGPIKNGLHTLSKPETTEEAIKNTNPLWDTDYGKMNCTSCVLASHLRQQGYDVNAKAFGFLGADVEKEYKKIIKNYKDVTTKTDVKTKTEAKNKILEMTKGENSSGAIRVRWQSGGGHIFNWKVENGKVIFYDVQPAGKEEVPIDKVFGAAKHSGNSTILYRFDTADFDWDNLRKYVHG